VWFRSPTEQHPIHGYLHVAFIGWRFAEPREELKSVFEQALQVAPTDVEWTFRSERNWMILPTRLLHEVGPDTRDFIEAVATITRTDQSFCATTAEDLEKILSAIDAASPDKKRGNHEGPSGRGTSQVHVRLLESNGRTPGTEEHYHFDR
jgi:hypothetical protein